MFCPGPTNYWSHHVVVQDDILEDFREDLILFNTTLCYFLYLFAQVQLSKKNAEDSIICQCDVVEPVHLRLDVRLHRGRLQLRRLRGGWPRRVEASSYETVWPAGGCNGHSRCQRWSSVRLFWSSADWDIKCGDNEDIQGDPKKTSALLGNQTSYSGNY